MPFFSTASRFPVLVVTALLALSLWPVSAQAADEDYAPVDRPGPELTVPQADLEAALQCVGDFSGDLQPVLFVPPTGASGGQTFDWNYGNVFATEGRTFCALGIPRQSLDDIQVSAEYIVHGIREMHERAGRRIAVLGHSQGGMSPRWALRFWPDTRAMVDDQIGMAASHHGTTLVDQACSALLPCAGAVWQQRSVSNFMAALNSRQETFAGSDYTSIYTLFDEVVQPTTGPTPASELRTGDGDISNVVVQDICPLNIYEHLAIGTIDPVTHALVMDALNNDGPADPARIPASVCLQLLMPGVQPLALDYLAVLAAVPHVATVPVSFANLPRAPVTPVEPALRCYVLAAGCPVVPDETGGNPVTPVDTGTDVPADGTGGAAPVVPASTGSSAPALSGGGTVSTDGQGLPAAGAASHAGLVLAGLLALALGTQVVSARRFLDRLA